MDPDSQHKKTTDTLQSALGWTDSNQWYDGQEMVDAGREEVEEISGTLVGLSDVEEGDCSVPDRFHYQQGCDRFSQ